MNAPIDSIAFLQEMQLRLCRHPVWIKSLPATVLLVDDDDNDLTLISVALEKYDCQVSTCDNAQEAIAMIKANHYDAIFLDVRPPINGLHILKETLPHTASSNVVLMTGLVLDSLIACRGTATVVQKPVSESFLAEIFTLKET